MPRFPTNPGVGVAGEIMGFAEDSQGRRSDYDRRRERFSYVNYICPNCGGGFNSWDKSEESVGEEYVCPFCGINRHQYDPED